MTKVVLGMTMSLDGFVEDRHGSVAPLYPDLAALGETESLQAAIRDTGAVVMGRRAYEMAHGDYTGYEFQTPIFVVTHHAPERAAKGENERLTFTFVTDGVASAIQRARDAASDKDVTVVGGASTFRQCLAAGLVDELHLDVRSLLLGAGLRLFDGLEAGPIALEQLPVLESPGVTHLRFRVVR